MKKFLLFIILLVTNQLLFGQCTTISDGTYGNTQTYAFTTYGLYEYGWSSAIYTPSEVGSSMTISSIAHYVDEYQSGYPNGPYTYNNLKVYMAHYTSDSWPDNNQISAGYTGISDWTLVYNSSMTYNVVNDWQTINLSTTFNYNGTSYLVVHIEDNNVDWNYGYPIFHYTNLSPTTIKGFKYAWTDGSMPTTGTRTYKRADIRFCGPSVLPIELISFDVDGNENYLNFTWVTASEINVDEYQIEYTYDGKIFRKLTSVRGDGNSHQIVTHKHTTRNIFTEPILYFRLVEVDFDGYREKFDLISFKNEQSHKKEIVGYYDIMGRPIDDINGDVDGLIIILYDDGTTKKIINNEGRGSKIYKN